MTPRSPVPEHSRRWFQDLDLTQEWWNLMKHGARPHAPARAIAKRALAVLAVGSAAVAALVTLPTTAEAADVSDAAGITSISFAQSQSAVYQYATYDMKATWSVPSTAKAGDTFSLTFPNELAYASTDKSFPLLDPSGETAANCVAIALTAPSTSKIVCTLTSYVENRQNVGGNLFFKASVTEPTSDSTVYFATSTGTVGLDVGPGGISGPYSPPPPGVPDSIQKNHFKYDNGDFGWELVTPSKFLGKVNGADPVIHDTWDARMTLSTVPSEFKAFRQSGAKLDVTTPLTLGTGPGTYSVTSTGPNSFDVVFHDPIVDNASYYSYVYATTPPANAKNGNTFTNTMSLGDKSTTVAEQYSAAGGDAGGNLLGGFTVTKAVTGTGATAAAGASYTVDYSYSANGDDTSGKLIVKDGETKGVSSIPDGTVVTLTEETPAPLQSVSYQTPIFTGIGVVNASGKATVTIGGGSTAAIKLENPTTLVTGGFSVTKSVSGPGASYVSGTDYTIDYSYGTGTAAKTGELTVKAGETASLAGIPVGTVVTLNEETPTDTDDAYYYGWIFSGSGVTQNDEDGSATLTIGANTTVAVQLENLTDLWPGGFSITKKVTGPLDVTATQTDPSGNVSPASPPVSLTVDGTPPAAPTIDPTNGVTVTGTAEPGSTVTIFGPNRDTALCTTTANSDGTYSCTPSSPIPTGTLITATATDVAGNTSPSAAARVGGPSIELSSPQLVPGAVQVATGRGFLAGESVSGMLESTPIDLGSQIADADGTVVFTITLPTDFTPGTHRVTLTGATSGSVFAEFIVVPNPSDSDGSLAFTGVNAQPPFDTGVLLILLGLPVLFWSRRRRSNVE
jgi:hypothetical protein